MNDLIENIQANKKEVIEHEQKESVYLIEKAKLLAVGIKDDATLQEASDFVFQIRASIKKWDKYNEDEKEKLNALVKAFRDRVNMVKEPRERADKEILSPAISAYLVKKEHEREKAETKQMDEAMKNPEDVAIPSIIPKLTVEGGSTRVYWDFEITDEALLPRLYLKPDLERIRKAVELYKDQTEIPGLRFFKRMGLVSKGERL
jgi:hypothetical protein